MSSSNVDLDAAQRMVLDSIPHARVLGIELLAAGRGRAKVRLAYRPELVGDGETGVLHGGVITTLMDTAGGIAVLSALTTVVPFATLDLRIDYLRPATPEAPLVAELECYKVTRKIAFVRGTAYQDDETDPVANCVGTFMITGGAEERPGAPG